MKNIFFEPIIYNFRRLKEYTQRYFHTRMNKTELREKILWELFVMVNTFLKDLNIDYWANYGTLLGFYRGEGIISHDIDIDFGCGEEHYSYIWENRDKLHPSLKMCDTSKRNDGPKLYISYKGFDADIYFYRPDNGKLQTFEKTSWENYKAPIPSDFVFPTAEMEVKGVKTKVPGKTKEYLTFIFGNLSPDAKRNLKTGYWE